MSKREHKKPGQGFGGGRPRINGKKALHRAERARLKEALRGEPTEPEYDPREYVPSEEIDEMRTVCESVDGFGVPDESTTPEMEKWFEERTAKHIGLVQKHLTKIIELKIPGLDQEVLEKELRHDESKLGAPERAPYVHISWKYRQADLGNKYRPPSDVEQKMKEATFHHVKNNRHHPEAWDDSVEMEDLNQKDRDKPGEKMVDATTMPLEYVASMCADWLAMSEEKGTDVGDWVKKNVNVRWRFSPRQVGLINQLCSG